MSRWLRLYDDTINNPKVLSLPEAVRWHWIAVLCIASKNDGVLPTIDHVAIQLRMTKQKAAAIIAQLVSAKLIDRNDDGFVPHNWNGRQYKSDAADPTGAVRAKKYRNKKRDVTRDADRDDRDAPRNETVCSERPETEADTETEKIPEAKASGAPSAPDNPRQRLFAEGLAKLMAMTGRTPDSCRSFLGKCLREANDEAIVVLGVIDDAERNHVANPTSWIAARLKPQGQFNGRRTVHDAAADLQSRLHALDQPAPSGLRGGSSEGPLRLLSSG